MSWLGLIVKNIASAAVGALINWWKAEKAEADAWNAKSHKMQMASMVSTLAEENRINTDPILVTTSISDWNAGVGLV